MTLVGKQNYYLFALSALIVESFGVVELFSSVSIRTRSVMAAAG